MHPYWILPITVGLGGLLLSLDQVFRDHTWTGMKILMISFFASALLVVIGWVIDNKKDEE